MGMAVFGLIASSLRMASMIAVTSQTPWVAIDCFRNKWVSASASREKNHYALSSGERQT